MKNLYNRFPVLAFALIVFVTCVCPKDMSAQYTEADMKEYIVQYQDIAIEKMKQYRIPASITLAQGIFESACGKSRLATEGNNHFGIKCHENWEGDTILIDDDELQECFRKYDSVAASYNDHSLFLTHRKRYANLFELEILDYEAWARTLKADGYATNPQYADRLISLIERFNIARLDTLCLEQQGIKVERRAKPSVETPVLAENSVQNADKPTSRPKIEYSGKSRANELGQPSTKTPNNEPQAAVPEKPIPHVKPTNYPGMQSNFKVFLAEGEYPTGTSPFTYRNVYTNNNTFFVIAEAGDTYEKIAQDVQISVDNIRRFNEAGKDVQPVEKEVVYIESKAKHNAEQVHVVERGETLRYISQRYAVQLSYIFKYNGMNENSIIQPGDKILLKH